MFPQRRALKDSTIRTVLRKLEERGYVTQKVAGRTFVYRPADSRRFCGGPVEEFVVGLVDNQVLPAEQLQQLAKKIAARKERKLPPPHLRGIGIQGMPNERARLISPQAAMAELAKTLGTALDSTVEDHTGLKAVYNISVRYAGHLGGPRGATALLEPPSSTDPSAPEPLPDIFRALESQLGLKLEKKKVSVEVLAVDHLEKMPAGN